MTTRRRRFTNALALLLLACAAPEAASRTGDEVTGTILELDREFWDAYNACDITKQRRFFTDDVEFYHDKGGTTFGVHALMDTIGRNLCGGSMRVRREAVEGTLRVFPMRDGDEVYGAILSGNHRFYRRDQERPETLDGVARFTHLWLLKDGAWKMARVLSYDHGPAR